MCGSTGATGPRAWNDWVFWPPYVLVVILLLAVEKTYEYVGIPCESVISRIPGESEGGS